MHLAGDERPRPEVRRRCRQFRGSVIKRMFIEQLPGAITRHCRHSGFSAPFRGHLFFSRGWNGCLEAVVGKEGKNISWLFFSEKRIEFLQVTIQFSIGVYFGTKIANFFLSVEHY